MKYSVMMREYDLYDVYNRARRDYMAEAIEKEWHQYFMARLRTGSLYFKRDKSKEAKL